MKTNKSVFETEVCSRCAGTGEYSYCQSHGTRCFRCGGSKITLTKKGEAAKKYYIDLCMKPVTEIKVGDKINSSGYKGFVQEITEEVQEGASLKDGVMVPYKWDMIRLHLKTISTQQFRSSKVFVYPSKELQEVFIEKSLAYQNTLTKLGKPRKRL